jgi:dihydrofolate reductase
MGKVVVSQFITMDGVVEDPGGSEGFARGGWAFTFNRGEEGDRFKVNEVMASGALLLGRVTYEGFAAAWPSRTGAFADTYNSMPKYVVSATLKNPGWHNTTVIAADVAPAVAQLKREVDGDILVNGSIQLVQELAAHDLVDEYRLMVFPTVLGAGQRLFGETSAPARFRLAEATRAGDTIILIFVPDRPDPAPSPSAERR